MKKALALFLILLMTLGTLPVFADYISVYVDGKRLEFDVPPQLINGRTMVPMRKIFESLGAEVSWDDPSQTATGRKGDTIVNITIDSRNLFKNGVPKVLDVAPALIGERTLVPARAIAESFDCRVEWVEETQSVHIFSLEGGSSTKTVLNAVQISEKVAPSVVYITVSDEYGKTLGTASAFFLSEDGVLVTNYHVLEDSSYAVVTTVGGRVCQVTSVIAYDKEMDIAVVRVSQTDVNGDWVGKFTPVHTGDSNLIKAGQTVYALGNPYGLQNTISDGIISNPSQMVEGNLYIQTTAAVSPGSSGGALVNEYGEVIGITSAAIPGGENLGFAIPINILNVLDLNAEGVAYEQFVEDTKLFTLDLYPTTLELEVGQSERVMVYAEGKDEELDWSIYWDTEQEDIVGCQWEDWLEDAPSVCPLVITGLKAGTATVTVFSDVDFKGKTITITVKEKPVKCYAGSDVPDYTDITGVPLQRTSFGEDSTAYRYKDDDINAASTYVNYLLEHGFSFYASDGYGGIPTYYYTTPSNKMVAVCLAADYGEVWIMVVH